MYEQSLMERESRLMTVGRTCASYYHNILIQSPLVTWTLRSALANGTHHLQCSIEVGGATQGGRNDRP